MPWFALMAPKGTPQAVVDRLNGAVNVALADATVQERLKKLNAIVVPMSPAEFGKLLANENTRWTKLVKDRSIKAEN